MDTLLAVESRAKAGQREKKSKLQHYGGGGGGVLINGGLSGSHRALYSPETPHVGRGGDVTTFSENLRGQVTHSAVRIGVVVHGRGGLTYSLNVGN